MNGGTSHERLMFSGDRLSGELLYVALGPVFLKSAMFLYAPRNFFPVGNPKREIKERKGLTYHP